MTAILGLNAFHPDSSACLVIDGKLVGAVAEERLGQRRKHTMSFPTNAIRWLLSDAGIRLSDVTHIAVARAPSANLMAKAGYALTNPKIGLEAVSRFLGRQKETSTSLQSLPEICGEDPARCSYETYFVEHHLAHIASSYYLSPFENAAGLSYDGSGDFASAMAARCEGPNIEVLDRVQLPHSLGHYYTAMCQFIGFDLFGEEYKVMGLAPYGDDIYAEQMDRIIDASSDQWFKIDPSFFSTHRGLSEARLGDDGQMKLGRLFSDKVVDILGAPRDRRMPITQREMDIARSTQAQFERAAVNCLKTLERIMSIEQLTMAGGCALNGVMNARIYRDFAVEKVYLQCAASDDGTAIGAAYSCWHTGLGKSERFQMTHGFWGPEYPDWRLRQAVEASGYNVYECRNVSQTVNMTADHIADGAVVGWYQGRSEWGPRALGNRSILANPAIKNMKDTINGKIKKRESFRPFAPSVLREEVGRFFEQDIESPFMMHVVKFKPEWREVFPAVTHVDGTGRLQSVDRDNNALYHDLISAVKIRTGYGIVLNTSFNENEPVVDTPEQAIACFDRTDMDVLVIGNFILVKPEYAQNHNAKGSANSFA
ncbi:putative carbamoyl transferase, NodU family [Marinovum algicola DG 898]|nr:putative carbamoyl transferase, NodU family [Marinovum algicola DG 898]